MSSTMLLIEYYNGIDAAFLVYGFAIVTKTRWENMMKRLKEREFPVHHHLGNGHKITYDFLTDFTRTISVMEISQEEHAAFSRAYRDLQVFRGLWPDELFEN
jgi:hypothetical protein